MLMLIPSAVRGKPPPPGWQLVGLEPTASHTDVKSLIARPLVTHVPVGGEKNAHLTHSNVHLSSGMLKL